MKKPVFMKNREVEYFGAKLVVPAWCDWLCMEDNGSVIATKGKPAICKANNGAVWWDTDNCERAVYLGYKDMDGAFDVTDIDLQTTLKHIAPEGQVQQDLGFDLERALKGEPVKLENGCKAYIHARLDNPEIDFVSMIGHYINEDGKEVLIYWYEDGRCLGGNGKNIACMWED